MGTFSEKREKNITSEPYFFEVKSSLFSQIHIIWLIGKLWTLWLQKTSWNSSTGKSQFKEPRFLFFNQTIFDAWKIYVEKSKTGTQEKNVLLGWFFLDRDLSVRYWRPNRF